MLSTLKVKSAKPEVRAYKLADSGGATSSESTAQRDCRRWAPFPKLVWQKRGLHTEVYRERGTSKANHMRGF